MTAQRLWVKPLALTGGGWAWVLCTDPDNWAASQVLASGPDDRKASRDSAVAAGTDWAIQTGQLAGILN